MSGHSKWSTIKRKKAINDQARGKMFSKLLKAISIAAKQGTNPEMNLRLKMAIEIARAANVPKENIDRIISRASQDAASLEEVTYEGFAPGGVGVIVETTTDNRNRTVQELKQLFERSGGTLGTPNTVAFNFDALGLVVLPHIVSENEGTMLEIMDMNVEDIEVLPENVAVYTKIENLSEVQKKLAAKEIPIEEANIVRRPKMLIELDEAGQEKVISLLEKLDEHDDVQQVFSNLG